MEKNNEHIFIGINNKGRDFIIGDLHGEYLKLEQRMEQVNFDKKVDRVFSVGDLIDRGPNSMDCLKLLDKPWFFSVQGNHEELMYKSCIEKSRDYFNCWIRNGGKWSLDEDEKELFEISEKLRELPLTITLETANGSVGISHASPPKSLRWSERFNESKEHLLWDRNHIMHWKPHGIVNGVLYTFHGHTPRDTIQERENSYYIDTGACWSDGNLSFVQVHPKLNLFPHSDI
jgi:serine/threonine protein phosphatase 1